MIKNIDVYLISDSTGETVLGVARSALAHFEGLEVVEHICPLFRSDSQIKQLELSLRQKPGIVMYTLVDKELKESLIKLCESFNIPCIAVLSKVVADLSSYLQMEISNIPGRQHILNDQYFSKVNAVNFSIAHDDGQSVWDLDDADIILLGASRTSKSPTCMYLSYRGYKTANIPFVLGCPLPKKLFDIKKPLVVGLTINLERLIQIRKNRLLSLNEKREIDYTDEEKVLQELEEAKKLFSQKNWPVIDVSKRSVEETAAYIIQLYEMKNSQNIKE